MILRTWCLAVAFGLITFSGEAQEQEGEAARYADSDVQPAYLFPDPVRVDVIESQAEADIKERKEEESRQREIRDLAAQEGMNAATRSMDRASQRMADYAFWSTVLVGIGTVLLVGTLLLTLQANKSAMQAVAVTREVARDQSRAYVHIEKIHWLESKEQFEFAIFVANSGQTPAKRFQIGATLEVQQFGSGPSGEISKEVSLKGWSALPGREIFQLRLVPFPIPNFAAIVERNVSKQYIILRGRLRYETIYGEIFETEFSFMGRDRGQINPHYAEHGSLGTKMSRTTEEVKAFELIGNPLK